MERAALPKVVVLLGCTATGKTRLAIDAAIKLNGEVINADSMQIYRSLNIMAAKASMAERRGVVHHCMDILAVTDISFNASRFVEVACAAIEDISRRGRLPIIVGGTHQYIEALLWRNYCSSDASIPPLDMDDDALLAALLVTLATPIPSRSTASPLTLYDVLKFLDPLTANKLRETDARKIRRALEIYHITGKPASATILAQTLEPRYDACILWLDTERDTLYRRLDTRVDSMLTEGLLAEARTLRREFLSAGIALDFTKGALQAIGFKELEPVLVCEAPTEAAMAECIAAMKSRSRNYARTQLKWVEHHFRTRMPLHRIDTTNPAAWGDTILLHAMSICEDFIFGRPYRVSALQVLRCKTEVRLDQWRKFECVDCQRELNGQTEWEAHLKSKGIELVSSRHKAHKKDKKKLVPVQTSSTMP